MRPLEPWELDKQLNKRAGMAAGDDLITWELLQDLGTAARGAFFDTLAAFWASLRGGGQGPHTASGTTFRLGSTELPIWQYPDCLKHSWVSPIPKAGYNGGTDRLRGICITPAGARCFNKIIVDRLTDFIESQGCLSNRQAGFRRGLSTHEPVARLEEFLEATSSTGGHVIALDLTWVPADTPA
jgi:hypothetical protein